MTRAPLLVGAPLIVGAALLAACSGPPPPSTPPPTARIVSLAVDDITPPDRRPAAIEARALRTALRTALTAAGLVVDGDDPLGVAHAVDEARARAGLGARSWRVELDARAIYGVSEGEGIAAEPIAGQVKAVWLVELELAPPDASPPLNASAEAVAEVDFAGGDAEALRPIVAGRLDAAAADVARQIAAQVDTLGQPVDALVEALAAAEPYVRRAAAERLGMLRDARAVPAIAERLRVEDDRETRLRLVGVLAEIGDDRAAEILIELATPRDREMLRAIIDALSVVGGARVDDFLDILSTHDDADVRMMVEQARRRLEQRR